MARRPLTALTPAVTVSAFATFTPTGAQDFSNSQTTPVPYTVTAEDGATQNVYQVTVVKAAASTACDMVSFTAAGVSGVITPGTPNTVTLMVPLGTDLASLTPTVVVSPLATYAPTGAQDFTNSQAVPVNYTVTAEDGTTQKVYAVTIIGPTPPPNDNFVNAIALPGTSGIQTGTGKIRHPGNGRTLYQWSDPYGLVQMDRPVQRQLYYQHRGLDQGRRGRVGCDARDLYRDFGRCADGSGRLA